MSGYPSIDELCQPDHICMSAASDCCEWRTVPSGETWEELHEIEDRNGKPLVFADVRELDGRFYRGDVCQTCLEHLERYDADRREE